MRLEHRWAPRRCPDWPVAIAYSAGVVPNARLRNISSGGALVQTSQSLVPHTTVELLLHASDGDTLHLHRLHAMVTRVSNDTVGLVFKDIDPQALAALLK
jgi:hypothetical protein